MHLFIWQQWLGIWTGFIVIGGPAYTQPVVFIAWLSDNVWKCYNKPFNGRCWWYHCLQFVNYCYLRLSCVGSGFLLILTTLLEFSKPLLLLLFVDLFVICEQKLCCCKGQDRRRKAMSGKISRRCFTIYSPLNLRLWNILWNIFCEKRCLERLAGGVAGSWHHGQERRGVSSPPQKMLKI